ncbi:MAG TPA: LacI family transcriptional regulator [Candidatus Fournierella merdigallinarum]|nr:LacI family transcriptional regulator [Candidatus Fournierella merdigallinarum]
MATLKDVARIAQVSPITVSRVINTPEKVKPATRERVRRVMSSLQYIPNVAAKNLVTKRSGIIDVFVPESIDLSDPFVMQFIAGVSNVLSRRMYSFLILRDRTREHFCDGYIVTGLLKNEILEFQEYAARRSRPVVLFGHTELQEVDCIDVDNVTGAKELVDRLIRAGHRRIAMINVAENKDYTADRYAGYEKALRAAGIPVDPGLVARAENTAAAGGAAAQRLLADTGCTAIFCATDTMAVGVCRAAAEKGLSIPGDLSLVGYDGLGHHLLCTPAVTTARQPVYEIGERLARTLLDRLDGSRSRVCELVVPEVVEGRSVDRPPQAAGDDVVE